MSSPPPPHEPPKTFDSAVIRLEALQRDRMAVQPDQEGEAPRRVPTTCTTRRDAAHRELLKNPFAEFRGE